MATKDLNATGSIKISQDSPQPSIVDLSTSYSDSPNSNRRGDMRQGYVPDDNSGFQGSGMSVEEWLKWWKSNHDGDVRGDADMPTPDETGGKSSTDSPSERSATDSTSGSVVDNRKGDIESDPSDIFTDDLANSDFDSLISGLNSNIKDAYTTLFGGKDSQKITNGITQILKSASQIFQKGGMSETNSMQLAQYVYNALFSLVNQQLTNDMQLRNWYMQQEFNLPSSQIQRLIDAGVNPAFYYSSASQSNAGEIGSTSSSAPTGVGLDAENLTDSQKRLRAGLGIAGEVGSLAIGMTSGGWKDITQGVANLGNNTAVLGNLALQQGIQPYQIGQMQALQASYWADALQKKTDTEFKPMLYRAQAYQLMEQGKNYSKSIDMMQKDLDNKLRIARETNYTTSWNNQNSIWGNIITANIGAAAQKYSADKSYAASKYAADKSYDASAFGSRLALAGQVLPHVYTHQRIENLYDSKTGRKIELSGEQRAKLRTGILNGSIDFREGAEFEFEGRKVTGAYFDTDVLDVMRLNGMNDYFNNFIETGHVIPKDKLLDFTKFPKQMSDMSDYLNMYDYTMPYVNRAVAHGIASKMVKGAMDGEDIFGIPSLPTDAIHVP